MGHLKSCVLKSHMRGDRTPWKICPRELCDEILRVSRASEASNTCHSQKNTEMKSLIVKTRGDECRLAQEYPDRNTRSLQIPRIEPSWQRLTEVVALRVGSPAFLRTHLLTASCDMSR